MPLADESPFENPETTSKFLGVPIDPAIHLDEPNYRRRIEQCALGNDGRYLYELTEFTTMIL